MSTFHATVSLALLLSSNDHAASHSSVLDRTVMAWVEGNWSDVARFVLEGDGKGAVNAISVEGMWTLSIPPSTPRTPRLVVNQDKVAEHRHIWQGGLAKARGIRTYPIIGFGGNMTLLLRLFEPATQAQFISDLAQEIAVTGVDGMPSQQPSTCFLAGRPSQSTLKALLAPAGIWDHQAISGTGSLVLGYAASGISMRW
eukprot:gene19552-22776_t